MADAFTKLDIHIILIVRYRQAMITKDWKERLHAYIIGILNTKKQKMLVINSMPDHLHMLVGIRPSCRLSDLMRDIKANTSKWINENHLTPSRFEWQSGYAAFAVGRPGFRTVVNYILNQETHHRNKRLRKEFEDLLIDHEVEFKTEYLPDDVLSEDHP